MNITKPHILKYLVQYQDGNYSELVLLSKAELLAMVENPGLLFKLVEGES